MRAAKDLRSAQADDEVEKILKGLRLDLDWSSARSARSIRPSTRLWRPSGYRSPRLRDGLIDIVLNHRMVEMRIKAAGALATQRDPIAVSALRQVAANPRTPPEVLSVVKSTIRYLESVDVPSIPMRRACGQSRGRTCRSRQESAGRVAEAAEERASGF